MSMRVWTFAAQKGGCGKSTLATQLAVYAEQVGEMTLLVDLDPQGSVGIWSQTRGTNKPMVLESTPEGLDEIISSAKTFGCSLVMLDTAPHSDRIAMAAIKRADLIICPSQSTMFDLASLRDTVRLITMTEQSDKAVGVVNFVPSDKGGHTAYKEAVGPMEQLGLKVCPQGVCFRRQFPKSLQQGRGVVEMEPEGKAAKEIQAVWSFLTGLSPIRQSAKTTKARVKT